MGSQVHQLDTSKCPSSALSLQGFFLFSVRFALSPRKHKAMAELLLIQLSQKASSGSPLKVPILFVHPPQSTVFLLRVQGQNAIALCSKVLAARTRIRDTRAEKRLGGLGVEGAVVKRSNSYFSQSSPVGIQGLLNHTSLGPEQQKEAENA